MGFHGVSEREPWVFGTEAEAVARKWLAFRYRLIPYLQTVIADAVATGMPAATGTTAGESAMASGTANHAQ